MEKQNNLLKIVNLGLMVSIWCLFIYFSSSLQAAEPILDERCNVNILNGSAQINENGTFALKTPLPENVPYRARVICEQEGVLHYGESVLLESTGDGITDTGEISFDRFNPVPVQLILDVGTTQLTPNSPEAQISVSGILPDSSTGQFTVKETGTVYRSSDIEVLTVSEDGYVTGLKRGSAIVSVRNEGTLASVQFEVLLPNDADGDGLDDEYEIANGSRSQVILITMV